MTQGPATIAPTSKASRWLVRFLLLASSLVLLATGVPRFLHEVSLVPGSPLYLRMIDGAPLSEQDLATLEQSRLDALNFVNIPQAHMDIGASYLTRAQKASDPADQQKYAQMAIDELTAGLKEAPLNTFAWARLAAANILLGEEYHQDALVAWRTSIATSSYDTFLLAYRFHIGTFLYLDMTREDIQLLKAQLAMAHREEGGKIYTYGKQHKLLGWMILLSAPNQEMMERFSQ